MIERRRSAPAVLRFKARLAPCLKSAKTSSGVMVTVPATVGKKLDGVESAEGTINGHPFRAALERQTPESPTFRVNQAMLRGSAARVGDTVQLAILGPEGKLVVAPDLRSAMDASPKAKALWSDLSDANRRVYVRWVDATDVPETRARRIRRTVEQLAEGKRRPCCVNTYEYPMSFIDPDWLKRRA